MPVWYSSVSTDVHPGTARLEGLRYKQVKTQNLLCSVPPALQGRKEQASSSETVGLGEGGKSWAGGGQPGLGAR